MTVASLHGKEKLAGGGVKVALAAVSVMVSVSVTTIVSFLG